MRGFICISLFFISIANGTLCSAQDVILDTRKLPKTIYYFEDYVDRSNDVEDYSNDNGRGYLKNGQYFYENKTSSSREYYNLQNIDPTKDYYIEVVFSYMSGPDDYGSGLVFNHSSTKEWNEYDFLISPNQYYKIYKSVNSVNETVQSWTHCQFIKPDAKNKLAVFAKGAFVYFYVNDLLVHEMKRPAYMGTNIGYIIAKKSVVAIDRFTIRYDPLPFNVVADAAHGLEKIKLDTTINSASDDNFPIISADGKMMFFSRTQNMGVVDLDSRTIMCSEYNDTIQNWSMAKPLSSVINQGGKPQVVYVSPDKKVLILNATYEAGKYISSGGLSISYQTDQGWSQPEAMFIENYENFSRYEGYSFSSDNKIMILSINKPKGFGETDLYISYRIKGTTNWTSPQNLGAVINSFGVETNPCLASDNVTLYYASGGKPGYGKTDIFVSRRLDDTWLNWSPPLNLGPDLNTKSYNTSFTIDADGVYAYMNKFEIGTKGNIAKIKLPESARPKPVVMVKGSVYDKNTNKPISATVFYNNIANKSAAVDSMYSNDKGAYVLVLPYKTTYELIAVAKGYIAESKIITIKDSVPKQFAEMQFNLYVVPLLKNNTVVLNTIVFEVDKSTLLDASFSELDRLYNVMIDNPNLIIEIQGYTDVGDANSKEDVLNALSLSRANAVKDYLVSKGISAERIKTIGYGRTKPVSGTGSALNRRVEVKVIKNE